MVMSVSVDNGKYTVQQDNRGKLTALRHGEEWRDCCGDNLIYHLAAELEQIRDKIEKIKGCLMLDDFSDTINCEIDRIINGEENQ